MYITNIYIFCVRNFCELWNGKCCCFTAAGTTPECMSRAFMCLTPSCTRADGKTCALTSVANANRKRPKRNHCLSHNIAIRLLNAGASCGREK